MSSLLHSRMLGALAAYYPSLCTIEEPSTTNVRGEVSPDPWTPLAGHEALRCRVSPTGGQEIKRADMIYTIGSHTIALAGHYPTITAKMRAVADGTAYDVLAVEHDGQETMTRLRVQVVR